MANPTPRDAIAMIPGRIGSTRLKMKNLALVDGKPMMAHAIRAAVESGAFSRVVVNADHPLFAELAREYGAEFYLRPEALGGSDVKSDDVVLDFMNTHPAEAVAWVNPTSPLQPAAEVRDVVEHFWREGLDSLITVEDKQVHCVVGDTPVNFSLLGKFAQTQDLAPARGFVYSVMMWRTAPFIENMRRTGYAFFTGKVGYFPVGRLSALIIKRAEDLQLADLLARAMRQGLPELQYHRLAETARGEK